MIKVIAVGRVKEKASRTLIDEYLKRFRSVHKLEVIELTKSKYKDVEIEKIVKDESNRILNKINPRDYVILLDLKGKDLDSLSLSNKIGNHLDLGETLVFVIGGSHGVDDSVRKRSNYMWKLSNLTFPHQLVRILLLEQLYRGFMIQKGHPYHK